MSAFSYSSSTVVVVLLIAVTDSSTRSYKHIYCGPEVLFETCVAMKFVDDDNDDDTLVS